MPTTAENVSTVLQNNWNDAIGIAKNDIYWPVTRVEVESWFTASTKLYMIASLCRIVQTSPSAQDQWRLDETVSIEIMIKTTAANFSTDKPKRKTMRDEADRIIHSNQHTAIPGAFIWVANENTVENFNYLRQILTVNCMYWHQKT